MRAASADGAKNAPRWAECDGQATENTANTFRRYPVVRIYAVVAAPAVPSIAAIWLRCSPIATAAVLQGVCSVVFYLFIGNDSN